MTQRETFDPDIINIFKIHGTIESSNDRYFARGLGATLESISTGLENWKRPILLKLIDKYTFVFLGYSGSDSYDINPVFFEIYDPLIHAGVIIRVPYTYLKQKNKITTTILVFEKGSVIITGARTCHQILLAYNYINIYLLIHHKNIMKYDHIIYHSIMKYMY